MLGYACCAPNLKEAFMLRRIRSLLPLLLVTFALTAAACADSTGPRADTPCDHVNNNTCH